jgi:hypothetical protein
MASLAKKTKAKRRMRDNKMGRERKRAIRANGTTPVFPIHKDKAEK